MLMNANRNKGTVPANQVPFNRQRIPSPASCESLSSNDLNSPETEVYKFVESCHSIQVLSGLNDLRQEGHFCDVTLSVDGDSFPAHKGVLAAFSPYFKAMFTTGLAEAQQDVVSLNGVEGPMLQLLLDFAYTSQITITMQNVQNLLSASNLLEVLSVRDACCRFLEQHMDATNCVGIHCFAESHACIDLQKKAKEYVSKHFIRVIDYDEWLTLPSCKIIEFISSDELLVDEEEAVFQAIVRWLHYNPESHQAEFPKVLEYVRLPLLSPYFLHDMVESQQVVRQSPECQTLVEEARLFHLLPDRRAELQSQRTRHRNNAASMWVVVAVGGEDDKVVLRSVECYEPNQRIWRTLACLPFAVSKHGLVSSGWNTVYMSGGEFPDGSASRFVWRYDPVLDVWQEMAPMQIPRSELGLAMLDGYVYAVGGWEGASRLDSVERYNPQSNTWQFVAPMKMAVTSPAVISHNGFLFVTGGAVLEDGDGIELVQRYDPKLNTWTELAPMLIPRSGSAACVLNGSIYVIGGWHASTENTDKVECYNLEKNIWEYCASMKERRYRPGVAVIDGSIYVLGGEEGWDRYHDTIERFKPEENQWVVVGEMPTSRSSLSCVSLQIRKDIVKEKS